MKISKKLLKEFYLKGKLKNSIQIYDKSFLYDIVLGKKRYLIKRVGKCDWKKCGNACCKIIQIRTDKGTEDYMKYIKNFGKKSIHKDQRIVDSVCCNLGKNGECKVWKKKDFSESCNQFPHITDIIYQQVVDKCSFSFEILYEIKSEDLK